jgi:rare lipoprotein A (peptidoglycan hydrolase)
VALAVAAAGLVAWPSVAALAAGPADSGVWLGVEESTAVAIGPEVSIDAKFAQTTATADSTDHTRLVTPATKRSSRIDRPKAGKPEAKRPERPGTRSASKSKRARKAEKTEKPSAKRAKKSKAKKSPTSRGWHKARVSWYGPGFYGKRMASGGKLKKNSMVVAHRSLPFGTKVRIRYKGRTVTAVVKDRGPYVRGRTFDLGPGTAKALGFRGVGTVRYKVLK